MVRLWGIIYKSVIHTVLLYERKRWMVTGAMLKLIEGLHHQADRRISGKTAWCTTGIEWEWPLLVNSI